MGDACVPQLVLTPRNEAIVLTEEAGRAGGDGHPPDGRRADPPSGARRLRTGHWPARAKYALIGTALSVDSTQSAVSQRRNQVCVESTQTMRRSRAAALRNVP